MAQYLVIHREASTGIVTGQYVPEKLSWSMRRSQPGEIVYEVPLADPHMTRPQGGLVPEFGPYRTHWYLYRDSKLLNAGLMTTTNLLDDRDSVLVSGKDWLHYLQRRLYPWNPNSYRDGDWINWPVGWPHETGGYREVRGDPVEVVDIVKEILARMQAVVAPDIPGVAGDTAPRGQLPIGFSVQPSGYTTKYSILPADTASIFDHIESLSEKVDGGFDFEITPFQEFKMYFPNRSGPLPVYSFRVVTDNTGGDLAFGEVTKADWTNEGPDGTFLWGHGVVEHQVGAVWYYKPSIDKYLWLDKSYDYGELRNQDLIFDKLKDQNDLYPQEKLSLSLLNPGTMTLSFFGGDRPRSLLGNRVNFRHTWSPYRTVDRYFLINAINCQVDQHTNEVVDLELEAVYELNSDYAT